MVKGYLAAVRHSPIGLGLGDPHIGDMPQLEYVVNGLKQMYCPASSRTRLPITPELLWQLRSVWATWPQRRDASMLWAAACMCFFGFLRAGEVAIPSDSSFDPSVHMAQGDVQVDSVTCPQYLEVTIKTSKTDPFRRGVSIYFLGDFCNPVLGGSHLGLHGATGPISWPLLLLC